MPEPALQAASGPDAVFQVHRMHRRRGSRRCYRNTAIPCSSGASRVRPQRGLPGAPRTPPTRLAKEDSGVFQSFFYAQKAVISRGVQEFASGVVSRSSRTGFWLGAKHVERTFHQRDFVVQLHFERAHCASPEGSGQYHRSSDCYVSLNITGNHFRIRHCDRSIRFDLVLISWQIL